MTKKSRCVPCIAWFGGSRIVALAILGLYLGTAITRVGMGIKMDYLKMFIFCLVQHLMSLWDKGFRNYYQIIGGVEPDEPDDTEPKGKEELRTQYESSHSLFGMVWQISSTTGWSVDYILWHVNYPTLLMMMADAPRYIKIKNEPKKRSSR